MLEKSQRQPATTPLNKLAAWSLGLSIPLPLLGIPYIVLYFSWGLFNPSVVHNFSWWLLSLFGVFLLLSSPLAIIFAIVSLRKIKKSKQRGGNLAKAALIITVSNYGFYVLWFIINHLGLGR